jgi:hypothetical protein
MNDRRQRVISDVGTEGSTTMGLAGDQRACSKKTGFRGWENCSKFTNLEYHDPFVGFHTGYACNAR